MKINTISILIVFMFCGSVIAQTNLAKAKKMQGKEVYILLDPIRAYEIVGERKSQKALKMFQKDGVGKQTISSKLEIIIKKFIKTNAKDNIDFDAILYQDGKHAYSIKFTDEATENTKGIGKTNLINGMPVFVLCEPVSSYSIVSDKRTKKNFKSYNVLWLGKNNHKAICYQICKKVL